jgi:HD-GYP domain-containing protein (c-di-GMP phosphodiesterase class II)
MTVLAKCSNCGEPFERLFKFCPNCGLSVVGEGFTDKAGVAVRDLFDIAQSFSAVMDVELLLIKISAAAEKLTQAEASSVMLLDDNKEYLYFKTAGGEKGSAMRTIKIPVNHGIAGWVAKNAKPLLIEDVAKDPRFSSSLADDKSGFETRSILCVPMVFQDEVIGVMEVLNKKLNAPGGKFTPDDLDIMGSLAGFAAVSIVNSKLTSDQKNFFANTIEILIAAVESRSRNSPGHCWRVAQASCAIARRLKIGGQTFKNIYYASLLHDIGYIGAQRQALEKKGFISKERMEALHPAVGSEMATTIRLLEHCANLIRSHHEYWDGSGFPDGLKGESIPMGARIISFVEAVEDLRDRLKGEGSPDSGLRSRIEQYASENIDILFDPQVVAAFLVEVSPTIEVQV